MIAIKTLSWGGLLCCVPGCSKRSEHNKDVFFHRLPLHNKKLGLCNNNDNAIIAMLCYHHDNKTNIVL